MSAKSNKIELSEEFMVLWREEQTPWDVMRPLYRDKNEKDKSFRSSHRRCSVKKSVLRNSAYFAGKHLCLSLFFNKDAGIAKFQRTSFLTEHLRATASKV